MMHKSCTRAISAVRAVGVRHASVRPGQPLDLTRYTKGEENIPVPGTIFTAEAERLGHIPHDLLTKREARKVPTSSKQYTVDVSTFKTKMSEYRAKFGEEVSLSNARIASAIEAYRAGVKERKSELDAMKAVSKQAAAAKTDVLLAKQRETKRLRADLRRRGVELRLARVSERRADWLRQLTDNSKQWIPEDKIDELITPDLFRVKYSWQFGPWFAAKESLKALREERRREKRSGQTLKEVSLSGDAADYDTQWDSDGEGAAGVPSEGGERWAGAAAADGDALADDTARTAVALAVARDAARERERPFPEPAYDAAGVHITDLHARVEKMASSAGIQLAELFQQKTAKDIVLTYEKWLAESKAVAGTGEDSGERPAENAYIAFVASTNRLEALYYSLVRKRRRLQAGAFQTALERFDAVWGEWLQEIHNRLASAAVPDALHAKLTKDTDGSKHTTVTEADVAALTDALFGTSTATGATRDTTEAENLRNIDVASRISEVTSGDKKA